MGLTFQIRLGCCPKQGLSAERNIIDNWFSSRTLRCILKKAALALFTFNLVAGSFSIVHAQSCGQGSSHVTINGTQITPFQEVCANTTITYGLSGSPMSEPSWSLIPSDAGAFVGGDNTGMGVSVTWYKNAPNGQMAKLRVDYPDMQGSQCEEIYYTVKIYSAPEFNAPGFVCSGATVTLDPYGFDLSPGAVWQRCTANCSTESNWTTIASVGGTDLVIPNFTQAASYRTRIQWTECGGGVDLSGAQHISVGTSSNLNIIINDPGPLCGSDPAGLVFSLQPGSVVGSNPTYQWKRNGGAAEGDLTPNDPTVYDPYDGAPYGFEFGQTIQLFVETSNPCDPPLGVPSNLVTITQAADVFPTFNGIELVGQVCEGQNAKFVAGTSSGNLTGNWSVGSGGFASTTNLYQPPSNDINGLVVNFSGTLTGSCGGTQPVTDHTDPLTVFPTPDVFGGNDEICSGETASIAVTTDIPGAAISWVASHTNVLGPASGTGPGISHVLTATSSEQGTATYSISATAPTGCVGTLQTTAKVNPNPTNPPLIIDPYCEFEVITLIGSATENVVNYKWYKPGGAYFADGLRVTDKVYPSGTYTYQYRAVDNLGCIAETLSQVTVDVISACDVKLNWIENIAFDYDSQNPLNPQSKISHSKSYFDFTGNPAQGQVKRPGSGAVWISQKIKDQYGRDAISTLSAPGSQTEFQYKHWFVTDAGGGLYDFSKFDQPVGTHNGTLGWYYSPSNTTEPLAPESSYPYTRVDFYEDGTGEVRKNAGAGEVHRMNQGHEVVTGTFPVFGELNNYLAMRSTVLPQAVHDGSLTHEAVQSIVRDQNGRYSISIADKSGKKVMSCGPGTPSDFVLDVSSTVVASGDPADAADYMPVLYFYLLHAQNLNVQQATDIVVEDLLTGNVVTPGATWPEGFYRILLNSTTSRFTFTYTNYFLDVSYQFYDDAGRLRASLSPNGYVQLHAPTNGELFDSDANKPEVDLTLYKYNHQGWLLSVVEPDAGETIYKYRKDGKIRFSQNAQQRKNETDANGKGKFSYTLYDPVGRPVESGEYIGSAYSFSSLSSQLEYGNQVTFSTAEKKDWVITHYDVADPTPPTFPTGYAQQYVRGAVSWSENINTKTWYSYDELGRVTWMAQKPTALNRIFVTTYSYDIHGNVLDVVNASCISGSLQYAFHHHYQYDLEKRLSKVYTSTDGTNKKLRATYEYYLHGPLKRIELGDQIQGIDFVYNIHGWLTQINHPDKLQDPGEDQNDVFGMVLDYYESALTNLFQTSMVPHSTDPAQFHNLLDPQRISEDQSLVYGSQLALRMGEPDWRNSIKATLEKSSSEVTNAHRLPQ